MKIAKSKTNVSVHYEEEKQNTIVSPLHQISQTKRETKLLSEQMKLFSLTEGWLFCGRIPNEGVRQVKACPKTDTCSPLSSRLLSQPGDQCDLSEVTHLLSDLRVTL